MGNSKESIGWYWSLLKESYRELQQNDPLKLSSSTAFFATFAIIPIIILLLSTLGLLFSRELLTKRMLGFIGQIFGSGAREMLGMILQNVQQIQQGGWVAIAVFVLLIFIATTLFKVIQTSFNEIWQVKPKADADIRLVLRNRGVSLIIILFSGLLFLLALLSDLALKFLNEGAPFLQAPLMLPVIYLLNFAFSWGLTTLWLAAMYKYLPDIKVPWKPVWFGAIWTGLLVLAGQFFLGQVLVTDRLDTIYGASASIILLLLFIFYCSFILYFGLCLVKAFTEKQHLETTLRNFSVRYDIREQS